MDGPELPDGPSEERVESCWFGYAPNTGAVYRPGQSDTAACGWAAKWRLVAVAAAAVVVLSALALARRR